MKKIIIFLTTCLLLLGSLAGVASAQAEVQAAKDYYPDLDYSMGAKKYGTTYMGDVLEQLLGEELSEAEKSLIREKFEGQNAIRYSRPSIVKPQIMYGGDRLSVVVMQDYIFDAEYDYEIYWTPVRLIVGGQSADFEPAPDVGEDHYRAEVAGIEESNNVLITVEFATTFTVSADTLNDFVNYAYDTALSLTDDYTVYQTELEQYRLKLEAYQNNQAEWTLYQTKTDEYLDYLDQVALYQDYLMYQDYLASMKLISAIKSNIPRCMKLIKARFLW